MIMRTSLRASSFVKQPLSPEQAVLDRGAGGARCLEDDEPWGRAFMRPALALILLSLTAFAPAKPPGTAQVIETSKPADWRRVDPASLLYMDVGAGTVIIELAPQFAPL